MELYQNLQYQKDNFYEVYNSYMNINSEGRVKDPKKVQLKQSTMAKVIHILCGDFSPILKEIFYLPAHLLIELESQSVLDELEEITLVNSYVEEVKINDRRRAEIFFTVPYNIKFYRIKLTKELRRKMLPEAAVVLLCKDTNFFECNLLKNFNYHDFGRDCHQALRDYLSNLTISYNEKSSIEELQNILSKKSVPIDELIEDYKLCVGLEITRELKKVISDKKKLDPNYLKDKVFSKGIQLFHQEGRSILENFLIKGNFHRNYILVDLFLKSLRKMEEDMEEFTSVIFNTTQFQDMKKTKTKMDLHINLLDSNLLAIDELFEKNIEALMMDIKHSAEEVG